MARKKKAKSQEVTIKIEVVNEQIEGSEYDRYPDGALRDNAFFEQ